VLEPVLNTTEPVLELVLEITTEPVLELVPKLPSLSWSEPVLNTIEPVSSWCRSC